MNEQEPFQPPVNETLLEALSFEAYFLDYERNDWEGWTRCLPMVSLYWTTGDAYA